MHFVIKPADHMLVNREYAQGVGDSRGVYLRLGHVWRVGEVDKENRAVLVRPIA